MIWYRLKLKEHVSLDSDFLDTTYSNNGYGRWHTEGVPPIYLADSIETAIAERGKYLICDVAERINSSLKSITGRPPNDWLSKFEKLKKIEVIIARIEVPDDINLVDLAIDPPALTHFLSAGFNNLSLDDVRRNSFVSLKGHPTRNIGTYFYSKNFPLLRVKSARTEGYCAVFFPDKYQVGKVSIVSKVEVLLHALDAKGKRLTGRNFVTLNENTFEYAIDGKIHQVTPLKL